MILQPEDYDARDRLLDDFQAWYGERGQPDDGSRRSDAELFVDFLMDYAGGEVSRFLTGELEQFLLEWCPRQLSAPPSIARPTCQSLESFVEFLHATDRLEGGAAKAAQLIAYLDEVVGDFEAAMGDESKFGMAKSLFFGGDNPMELPTGSLEEVQAQLEARMAAHNALPIEERRAATDRFFTPPLVDLPFSYLPASPEKIEESAAAAPILSTLDRLRDYLGEKGRTLTQKGNLKLADARDLVELLQTGDVMDPDIGGGRIWKTVSSADLPGLSGIVELALTAGVVRRDRGRLVPVKRWTRQSATAKIERIWAALFDLYMLYLPRRQFPAVMEHHDLLVDGIPHWLLGLVPEGSVADFDQLKDLAREVTRDEFVDPDWGQHLVDKVDRSMSEIFEIVERAGVIRWEGWRPEAGAYSDYRTGGDVQLTAVGRHLVAGMAEEAGYRLKTVPDLALAGAPELIEAIGTNGLDPAEAAARWRPEESDDRRAAEICEVLRGETDAVQRLTAFSLLDQLAADQVEPSVRPLLDTPMAAYVAVYLLSHGLATEDQVGSFIGVGPLVDVMSVSIDNPGSILEHWESAFTGDRAADTILEQIWRHPAPETEIVLETLGKILPDKRQAKAARKALIKHRSWMANR